MSCKIFIVRLRKSLRNKLFLRNSVLQIEKLLYFCTEKTNKRLNNYFGHDEGCLAVFYCSYAILYFSQTILQSFFDFRLILCGGAPHLRSRFKFSHPVIARAKPEAIRLIQPRHFSDERSHFFDERSHFSDERSRFFDERSHFFDERPHFFDKRSHFSDKRPHFFDERSHFSDERSHFFDERSHFSDKRRDFLCHHPTVGANYSR